MAAVNFLASKMDIRTSMQSFFLEQWSMFRGKIFAYQGKEMNLSSFPLLFCREKNSRKCKKEMFVQNIQMKNYT